MDIWRIALDEDCNFYPSDFEKRIPVRYGSTLLIHDSLLDRHSLQERETFLEHRVKKTSNHQVVYEEEKAISQLPAVVIQKLGSFRTT